MRTDVPAAFPLIGLVAGLACGPLLVNPWLAILGLLVIPRRLALFAALGIALAIHQPKLATFEDDRFVQIEAPIERDWSERKDSFLLRSSNFAADGKRIDVPLAIYTRFEPPQIGMEKFVRVEAFVRLNEHGQYVASVKSPRLLSYHGRLAWWHPASWNRALANRLEPHADEHPLEVAMAQALVLGRGERLDDELRDSYRRGGTYHLLVFSGLQIAFAAAVLAALLRWLHRPRASDWLLLAFAIVAPLFIGPTASVSRASIGIGLYALARIVRRPTSLHNLWCVAAIVRLILEPGDLGDAAFHLTYAGAGALLFIGNHLLRRRWIAHVVAAETTITPLVVFHFHQYALGGAVLTLVMSPLIFAMLVASAFACAVPCDAVFAIIGALHRACAFLNQFGVSGFFTAPPKIFMIATAASALAAIAMMRERSAPHPPFGHLLPANGEKGSRDELPDSPSPRDSGERVAEGRVRGERMQRRRAIAIVLALLVPSIAAIVQFARERRVDHPHITFFDVGQGDAIAIRSGAQTILVDGGPGERILPLLVDRGIRRIDAVVLTHAHPDHCEGLAAAIEHLDVRSVWLSPRRFHGECAARVLAVTRAPIHLIRDGDALSLPGIRITAHVAPHTFRRSKENNASVVLLAQIANRRVLLTGDIEREAEIHFDDRDFRADVLKVAHHGSRTSTSRAFLELVRPRIAVISCGRRNLFGHPHPSVLHALAEDRVRTWRTDRDGTIDVEMTNGRMYVRQRND